MLLPFLRSNSILSYIISLVYIAMGALTRDHFYAWKQALWGSDHWIWRNGLNTTAATSLKGEERTDGILMLLFGINIVGDSDSASALAAMGETSAIPAIRAALRTARTQEDRVRFALAIHELSMEDSTSNEMAEELIDVLKGTGEHLRDAQISSAMGLRDFKDVASEQALLTAVERNTYLVRYHACESLFVRWAVEPPNIYHQAHIDIFNRISGNWDGGGIKDQTILRSEAVILLEKLRDSNKGCEETV